MAHDPELDREVALKLPRAEALITEETRLRYLREAKTVASLSHPNIASVYEAGQIGLICYIVSAYCRGGALSNFIENVIASAGRVRGCDATAATSSERASYNSIGALMVSLARAVQHAHDRGVLHRDLKPSNILFDFDVSESDVHSPTETENERHANAACNLKYDKIDLARAARIVDFGLAKSLDRDDAHTRTGMTLGTPSYMSPEQAHGDKSAIGPATDIYSLGAILYELLTGRPPFQKPSQVETLVAVKVEDPLPPRRIHAASPKDLEAICLKCLEKEPSRRYASAALLADDLQRYVHGEVVHARTPSLASRIWRWCRRYPLAALLAITIVGLAIVAPIVAFNQSRLYQEAELARHNVRRTLYTSDMNLALRDWEAANVERCGELLRRHLPPPGGPDYRGFEWYYLWRLYRESEQVPVVAHLDDLEVMAISPDESLLALGGHDGSIVLTEHESGRQVAKWKAHTYHTFDLAFSPDGKTLASASIDNEVRLWDVATRREHADLSGSRTVAMSRVDGTLAYRTDATSIAILDPGQTEPRVIADAHSVGVGCVVFSPDGKLLASAGWDSLMRIWDVANENRQSELPGHAYSIWVLDWSPNGKYLASGDVYGTIKLWDAATGTELVSLDAHTATVRSIAFSADSTMLASAAEDNTLKLWKVPGGRELRSLRGHYGSVLSLAFAAGGSQLLSASIDGDVKSWTITETESRDVLEHPEAAKSVAVSPDNQLVATTCSDGQIRLWNAATGELIDSFAAHAGGAWRVRFVPGTDGDALVSTGQDGMLRIWDLASRQVIGEFPCRPATFDVVPVAVSTGGSRIAFADSDLTMQTWDLDHDTPLHRITVGNAKDVAFSPDGQMLAVAAGNFVKIRDAATGDLICDAWGDSRYVECVKFSSDSQTLAAGSFDRTIKLWKVASFTSDSTSDLAPHLILRGPASPVPAIAFSHDGSILASVGDDRVRLWNPTTGEQRAALSGHKAHVVDLAFSADGQILASASYDSTVRLWRAPRDVEPLPLQ